MCNFIEVQMLTITLLLYYYCTLLLYYYWLFDFSKMTLTFMLSETMTETSFVFLISREFCCCFVSEGRPSLSWPTPRFHTSVSGLSHQQIHLHGLPFLSHTEWVSSPKPALMGVCLPVFVSRGWPGNAGEGWKSTLSHKRCSCYLQIAAPTIPVNPHFFTPHMDSALFLTVSGILDNQAQQQM